MPYCLLAYSVISVDTIRTTLLTHSSKRVYFKCLLLLSVKKAAKGLLSLIYVAHFPEGLFLFWQTQVTPVFQACHYVHYSSCTTVTHMPQLGTIQLQIHINILEAKWTLKQLGKHGGFKINDGHYLNGLTMWFLLVGTKRLGLRARASCDPRHTH